MENNLDKLFKSKFGGQEPEFDPAAWDRMEELLDAVGMTPAPKKKSNRNKFFYLSLLFIGISVSIIGYMSIVSSNTNGEGSTLVDNAIQPKIDNPESNSINSKSLIKDSNTDQNINSEISQSTTASKASSIQESDFGNDLEKYKFNAAEKKDKQFSNSESKTTFKNIQPKPQQQSIEDEIINHQITFTEALPNNNLNGQNIFDKERKSNGIAEYNEEIKKDEALYESGSSEVDILKGEVEKYSEKEILPFLDFLNTRPGTLLSIPSLISPQIQTSESSVFTIGVMASARFSGGAGYSVGPYVSYNIGKGYAINIGGQFDAQYFDAGPQMSVVDKVYSFGSKLSERKFSLTNQKSLRIPLSITKSFNGFSLTTGAIVNKVFASEGSISKAGDGTNEENVIIDSDMINPMTLSLQMGASVDISRHIDIDFGIEYKPKAFVTDLSTSNNANKYYPTVGLRYKLFKF